MSFESNIGRENAGDDWRIGDWAECLDVEWDRELPDNPKAGDRLIVSVVKPIFSPTHGYERVGLKFVGKPKSLGWDASHFRKIISDMDDRTVERKATRPVLEPTA